jgi:hypothetical protein
VVCGSHQPASRYPVRVDDASVPPALVDRDR